MEDHYDEGAEEIKYTHGMQDDVQLILTNKHQIRIAVSRSIMYLFHHGPTGFNLVDENDIEFVTNEIIANLKKLNS